jgi:biotin carboxylase
VRDAAAPRAIEVGRGRGVLLVEEGWSQTLALAAALEDAGHAVTVLTANGGAARCVRRTVRWCSGPALDDTRFVAHVDRVVREAGVAHVVPMTEAVMTRLWHARPAWADRIVPAADDRQRRLLRDKLVMTEHMATRGLLVPRQRRLTPATDPRALIGALGLPLVVKAAAGSGGRRVWIVETAAQLARALARARALGGEWGVQERVAGPTFLVGGVFHAGRPLRIYAAEKLEQHPPRTGPAIRLRSDDDPALLELGLRAIGELGWTGFASVDCIRRPDGRHVFLEINPRLWGSCAAARSAGVDLFAPFAALLAGDVPAPDLGFTAGDDHRIFPRYLLSPRYWHPAGAARAVRDLLRHPRQDWRHAAFVRHVLTRLYRLGWPGRPGG